ncbi:hypothetical protein ACFXK0_10090 [Nocardia sp. NPDC059177]|uniref:hypothetical protein n=1 Tax=Nocardia sp. NPDC059177 TaxID=3346759 RepID=UPI0036A8A10C
MTTQHARGARRRTVFATTALGLLCGLAAWLLFEWWASDIDGFVVYDASYEPLPDPVPEVTIEPGPSTTDSPLRIGLVAVPTAIGLIAGCVGAAWGLRLHKAAD